MCVLNLRGSLLSFLFVVATLFFAQPIAGAQDASAAAQDATSADNPAGPLETLKAQFGKRPLDKPFIMAVHLKVKPGQRKSFIAAMRKATQGTRKEAANVRYQLVVSASDPNVFVLNEQWRNFAGLEKHFETPHLKALLENFDETLASPPRIDLYFPTPMGGGKKPGGK